MKPNGIVPTGTARVGEYTDLSTLVKEYEDHRERLVNFAFRKTGNREDAEDIAIETYIRAFGHIYRGNMVRVSTVRIWLLRIASRLCLDFFRERTRRVRTVSMMGELSDEEDAPLELEYKLVDHRFHSVETKAALAAMWRRLTPGEVEAVLLVDVENLSYRDAAKVAGVAIGTIRSRLHHGRRLLRRLINDEGGYELFVA